MKVERSSSSTIKGEWAKAKEDIADGNIITILDEGQMDESGAYGPKHVFKVETKNGEKNLSINKSSVNNLIEAYGDDTALWVGKKAKAYVVKQMVGDGMKNVIYLVGSGFALDDEGRLIRTRPVATAASADDDNIPTINTHLMEQEKDIKIEDVPF